MLQHILILFTIGLLTGTITAMSAGSGVMVVVPLLVLFFGYSIHEAIGTSLLVDVIASLGVAFNYYRFGRVDFRAAAWLVLGSILGAQAGSHLAAIIPHVGLKSSFSIFVILSGLSFWVRALQKKRLSIKFEFKNMWAKRLTTLAIGIGIGLFTGIFGAGGGANILIVLTYVMNFPLHAAIGTATAIMAFTAASGAVGYAIQGNIPWLDGLIIALGTLLTGTLFTGVANRSSEKTLNWAVGSIFVLIGVTMLFIENGGTATTLLSILLQ